MRETQSWIPFLIATFACGRVAPRIPPDAGPPPDAAVAVGSLEGRARVTGQTENAGLSIAIYGPANRTTETDGVGDFVLIEVPVGEYVVTATAASTVEATLSQNAAVIADAGVRLNEFVFAPAGGVSGRVVVVGKTVDLSGIGVSVSGAPSIAVTNDAGAYLLNGVPTGARTVTASIPGVGSASAPVTVDYAQTVAAPDLTITALPETTITSAPAAIGRSTSATIAFASDDPAAWFRCAFDGADASACISPRTFNSLAEGAHSFTVFAENAAGADPTLATVNWIVDTVPPTVTINGQPATISNVATPQFAFYASEPDAGFTCRIDNGTGFTCASPHATPPLTEGLHTFTVSATDPAGNQTLLPPVVNWTIDSTPPNTNLHVAPPALTKATFASFAFSATESALFLCRLDDAGQEACESPKVYLGVAEGTHRFEVVAADLAGNFDPTPISWSWRVDTTAPETTIVDGGAGFPPPVTNLTTATFSYGADDPLAGFTCYVQKNGSNYTSPGACASPKAYTNLLDGNYRFIVYATDDAGNVEPVPAEYAWTVDSGEPPVTPPVPAGLAAEGGDGFVKLTWNAVVDSANVGYKVYRDGGVIASVAGVTYTDDAGLTNYDAYPYQVSSFRGSGSESGLSTVVWGVPYIALPTPGPRAIAVNSAVMSVATRDGGVFIAGVTERTGDIPVAPRPLLGKVVGVGGSGSLGDAKGVAVGDQHHCAIVDGGALACWGRNTSGQLGDYSTVDRQSPVVVRGPGGAGFMTGVRQVALGNQYSCAVQETGGLYCWGLNSVGKLGDGTTSTRYVPTAVAGPGGIGTIVDAIDVAAGGEHTCAVRDGGSVWCWGSGDQGQLRQGDYLNRFTPVRVSLNPPGGFFSGATAVSAGDGHTCASVRDGTVWCWGQNQYGRLGDGSGSSGYGPFRVVGASGAAILTGVRQVVTGGEHSCALKLDGTVWCWGYNSVGQLGDWTTISRSRPVQVRGPNGVGFLSGVETIAAGTGVSCATTDGGAIWCWGDGTSGALADNYYVNRATPVRALGTGPMTGMRRIVAGSSRACAIDKAGGLHCWGSGGVYALGDGTAGSRAVAVRVLGEDGVTPLNDVVLASPGSQHTCAVTDGGAAWCWGRNDQGQVGNWSGVDWPTPQRVSGPGGLGFLSEVVGLSAGGARTYAVTDGGALWGWGSNNWFQLGDGTTAPYQTFPVPIVFDGGAPFSGAVHVSAGPSSTCATQDGGALWCWGPWDSVNPIPEPVLSDGGQPLGGALQVATGYDFACARLLDRSVRCWGSASWGVLGNGSIAGPFQSVAEPVVSPTGIGTISGVDDLSAGDYSSCALVDAGVFCWGDNSSGQLGDGTNTSRARPVAVVGPDGGGLLGEVIAVTVGSGFACALVDGGAVFCWGGNGTGNLGDGTTVTRPYPAPAMMPVPFSRE